MEPSAFDRRMPPKSIANTAQKGIRRQRWWAMITIVAKKKIIVPRWPRRRLRKPSASASAPTSARLQRLGRLSRNT
jgi:hypothetical protein